METYEEARGWERGRGSAWAPAHLGDALATFSSSSGATEIINRDKLSSSVSFLTAAVPAFLFIFFFSLSIEHSHTHWHAHTRAHRTGWCDGCCCWSGARESFPSLGKLDDDDDGGRDHEVRLPASDEAREGLKTKQTTITKKKRE